MSETLQNTIGHAGFLLGCLSLTCFFAYALWIKLRVMRLRQDIYDYRNGLWDFAFAEGYLQEPAYVVARQHLNALAQCSKYISLHLIRTTAGIYGDISRQPLDLPPCDAKLKARIELAFDWSAERISRYIYRETCAGWFTRPSARPQFHDAMRAMRTITISSFARDEVLPFILSEIPATIIDLQETLARSYHRLAKATQSMQGDLSQTQR